MGRQSKPAPRHASEPTQRAVRVEQLKNKQGHRHPGGSVTNMTTQLEAPRPQIDRTLYIDLDGTLLKTDMLWESALLLVRSKPWLFFSLLMSAIKGRAYLKRYIANRVDIKPETLPFNRELLEWLRLQHDKGRRLVLATASDELLARKIAAHLNIFADVIGSDGVNNLKSSKKLASIQQQGADFEYAGNSRSDLIIWNSCTRAIPVGASKSIISALQDSGKLGFTFEKRRRPLSVWRKAIRAHQWSKNFLVFIPLLAGHKLLGRHFVVPALELFWSLSFLASATYILNDLLDLTADREHPQKRFRALASGEVTIPEGIVLALVLFAAGVILSAACSLPALIISLAYVAISMMYSFWLKRLLLIDVFTLSGLYTLRIIGGGVVSGIMLSGWLLSFSCFLFLSLGFSKRTAELCRRAQESDQLSVGGRAYRPSDLPQINQFGVVSGLLSSLVLALYIGSDQVRLLYSEPNWLWLIIPLSLYWITRLWLIAYRGELNEDPVVFALTDSTTIFVCLGYLVVVLFAMSGLHVGFMQ